jgi:hypothetical protein
MKIVAMENNANTPMLHAALVYQIKKSRGINWTPSEKVSRFNYNNCYLIYLMYLRRFFFCSKESLFNQTTEFK